MLGNPEPIPTGAVDFGPGHVYTSDRVQFHPAPRADPRCLPTSTDDVVPEEAAQTSCPHKAACGTRNLPSILVHLASKEHLSVNLPTVQLSVWNHSDICQRGLEIVTGGLQIMKPMPFIDTRGSCLIWDVGCQKIELFVAVFSVKQYRS